MIWYGEKKVGDAGYYSGNVKNGPGIYLPDGLLMDMMETWMRTRFSLSIKKGWLCRNFLCLIDAIDCTRWGQWQLQRWWLSDDDQMCWWLWRENTFLVKRECCCNCNFETYSDVYYYCILLYPLRCTYTMIWYDEKTVLGDTGYYSGNVKNGPSLYLRDGLLMDMMKT